MSVFENISLFIPIVSFWLMVLLSVIILALTKGLMIRRRQLNDCRRAIVRLINEKEELKKQLPPEVRDRYLPTQLTKNELLNVLKIIFCLLAEIANGYVSPHEHVNSSPSNSDIL